MSRERPVATKRRAKRAARGVALAELALRQHGVVTLAQLEEHGVSPSAARSRQGVGRMLRVHRGVYMHGAAPLTAKGLWMAAVLACGPRAALSHRSCGALWDLRGSSGTTIDVTVATRAGRCRRGLRIHGSRLSADEITSHEGIPCTSVARTLLDLAAVLDRRGLERAVERSEILGIFDLKAVAALLERHRGRRGAGRLQAVVGDFDTAILLARSELEVRFLRLARGAGLPPPIVNGRIEVGGMTPEVDFHWPAWRLVVEVDGRRYHRTNRARAEDARRDRALTAAGWTVVRATWAEVVDAPEALILRLRGLLSPSGPRAAGCDEIARETGRSRGGASRRP